jgi:rubrerythrin
MEAQSKTTKKLNLRCLRCGYGVLRPAPPERCPMCQAESAWIRAASRGPGTVLSR